MAVTDEASSGHEVLGKIRKNNYDVLVLDVSMPGMTGLDVIKQIKSEKYDLPILILSMHSEEQFAVRTIKAGASGYLVKDSAPDELVTAIQKISKGGKYITQTLAEKLAFELERDTEKLPHQILSNREYQVLCMIASGKTVKEIAEEIYLSIKTISTYRSRILEKMNMKTNAELTHYTIKNNLID
jgi:DNA-binding NarL/FixJ family response regulator